MNFYKKKLDKLIKEYEILYHKLDPLINREFSTVEHIRLLNLSKKIQMYKRIMAKNNV